MRLECTFALGEERGRKNVTDPTPSKKLPSSRASISRLNVNSPPASPPSTARCPEIAGCTNGGTEGHLEVEVGRRGRRSAWWEEYALPQHCKATRLPRTPLTPRLSKNKWMEQKATRPSVGQAWGRGHDTPSPAPSLLHKEGGGDATLVQCMALSKKVLSESVSDGRIGEAESVCASTPGRVLAVLQQQFLLRAMKRR